MVNYEIPHNYTSSPSSFVGTPHLTINREATVDLDSSNSFEGPEKLLEVWFAPSPKALPPSARSNGLKSVPAAKWTEMLDLVHCKVLSVIESDQVDAYLLSESSMFVFPHKLVLKTCGTTTLLYGLPSILEIAALSAGFPHTPAHVEMQKPAAAPPYRVFYSRKNYLYPDQQRGPHRSWRDEVRALDRLFQHGAAYMIGKMNGEHWYLYVTEPDTRLTPPATPEHEKADGYATQTRMLEVPDNMAHMAYNDVFADVTQDETLEILMTDLDVENSKQFYVENASAVAEGRSARGFKDKQKELINALGSIDDGGSSGLADNGYDVFEQTSSDHGSLDISAEEQESTQGHALGAVVSEASGLAALYPSSKYPDARIDAYLFTPCGFSANGVIPAPAPTKDCMAAMGTTSCHYFTVHVTPEPHCSYASFETNVPARQTGRETADVIEQVVDIFQPGRFSVTLFEAKPLAGRDASVVEGLAGKKSSGMDRIRGYRRVDRIVHELDGYDLVFRYYERWDWKGAPPRLGE